jgi:hypothetical protein
MQDCVAVQNSSNFRFWYQNVSLSNCVATYPRKRGLGISSNSILSIWLQNATVNADRFTAHGDVGTSVKEVGTGSATLTNSILSYTGSDGSFTQGAVALGTGTVTYRPGAGVDPDYVNPSASWNGVGDDMNSQTYGTTKGYHRSAGGGSMVTIDAEADTYVWDNNPSSNYGTQSTLFVKDGSSGWDRVSYIRFPVSSLDGAASSVTLKLKVMVVGGEGAGDRPIEVRQLANDSWSETGTTWNNRPSTTGTLIATIPDAGMVGQTYEVDVTSYVNTQSTGDGTASFVLIQSTGTNRLVEFGSRENTGNKPTLEAVVPAAEIEADADTYVWDSSPPTNYGTQSTLLVKDGPSSLDRVSYIRFPVSSIGGSASSVVLKLKVVNIGGEGSGDRPIEVRQLVNDSWSETETTWNNRPSTTGTLIATIPDAGTVGQTYSVNVTNYINAQSIGDGAASFVLIQPAGTNRMVGLGSRENAANKPVLISE